jgi:hypothetical protein
MFNIGDLVVLTGNGMGSCNNIGDVGIVIECGSGDNCRVQVGDNDGNSGNWSYIDDLELANVSNRGYKFPFKLKGFSESELKSIYGIVSNRNVRVAYQKNMKKLKTKTIFHYKRLSKDVASNFEKAFDVWVERGYEPVNQEDWVSDCGNFVVKRDELKVVTIKNSKDIKVARSISILSNYSSYVRVYKLERTADIKYVSSESVELISNKLLLIIHNKMMSLGVDVYTKFKEYHKTIVMDNDIRRAISSKVNIDNIKKYALDNDYSYFQYDETDDKINFKFKGRLTVMKTGKAIRRFLKHHDKTVSDEYLKQISNVVSSNLDNYELKVVEGDDIDFYYNGENYESGMNTGSLQSSCMRYSSCANEDFFQIYKDNAKMLILVNDDNKIAGRAILWDDVRDSNTGDKTKVMDRIYANEKAYHKFFVWAEENGYIRKQYQGYDNETSFVDTEGVTIEFNGEMDINLSDYDKLPYMDTFAWGCDDELRNEDGYGEFYARDTDGALGGREDADWDNDGDY